MSLVLAKKSHLSQRIKVLTPEVANHIAAGEVVAKPASIVKELLENSIDAKSSKVSLRIDGGGIAKIMVTDDGLGICYDDLSLAVMAHATSKVAAVVDLDSITSLGFRGEALASIAAVTKFKLTSKPSSQDMAYSFSNVNCEIEPAAHPDGTTVIAEDIFYNTPARRKFLRSPKTETHHVAEIFRRIALSNFGVSFDYYQGSKLVKKLPAAVTSDERCERVKALCGGAMLQQAITVDIEQNGMKLKGWLNPADCGHNLSQHQYFFLNNRFIRDRLISGAIRQGFLAFADPCISYCLYLEIDPVVVDVNVHPTKHEVRFRDSRIIYAFIEQAIYESLKINSTPERSIDSLANNEFKQMVKTTQRKPQWAAAMADYAQVLQQQRANSTAVAELTPVAARQDAPAEFKIHCVIANTLVIAEQVDQILLVDLIKSRAYLMSQAWNKQYALQHQLKSQPLSEPSLVQITGVEPAVSSLTKLGWDLTLAGDAEVTLRGLPAELVGVGYKDVLQKLLDAFVAKSWAEDNIFPAFQIMAYAAACIRDITNIEEVASICEQITVEHDNTMRLYRKVGKDSVLELLN